MKLRSDEVPGMGGQAKKLAACEEGGLLSSFASNPVGHGVIKQLMEDGV